MVVTIAAVVSLVGVVSSDDQVCANFGAPPGDKICATERTFDQQLDHFSFANITTWPHRYLDSTQFWGNPTGSLLKLPEDCPGPILLYTGNEGPIDAFWGSNGFMIHHLAPTWGAALLFPEERYYGKSQPFGAASLNPAQAAYLTTEQVLADYAAILTAWKTAHNATSCPVLAFGGSYGGTLTTYFRRTYPGLTCGGLAASAPIGYYANSAWTTHGITEYTWIDIVQRVFSTTEHGTECFSRLTKAVEAVAALGATAEGRRTLATRMHLCSPAVLGEDPTNFLIDALETLPQEDYPYAVGSLPGWPVNATCQATVEIEDPIDLAVNITSMYYGWTGSGCLDGEGQGGIPGGGPGPASWGPWGYQSCTETLHQFSSSLSTGHGFRDFKFSMESAASECEELYAVKPNPAWAEQRWGGFHIGDGQTGVTHLIWSHGGLDPWSGGCFKAPFTNSDELHWFYMPQGAHHLDLRGPHPDDPANVTATRSAEETILKSWIESCPHLG